MMIQQIDILCGILSEGLENTDVVEISIEKIDIPDVEGVLIERGYEVQSVSDFGSYYTLGRDEMDERKYKLRIRNGEGN